MSDRAEELRETWRRMSNPKTFLDYGLSINLDEALSVAPDVAAAILGEVEASMAKVQEIRERKAFERYGRI